MIVDLFAGPGGWDEGLRSLSHPGPVVGLEWDEAACETRAAAGHLTIRADVAQYPTDPFRNVDGLIASPPCQAFSLAGKGEGRDKIDALLAHVRTCSDGWRAPPETLCGEDVRADLTLQPIRWVDALRPRWVACEQVPPALPLWQEIARVLDGWGYSTWTGVLRAEEYGVPQTRKRAFLLARRDGRPALPPEPTHTRYDHRLPDGGRESQPSLFGVPLEPWISMADALDVSPDLVLPSPNRTRPNDRTPERRADQPAPTVLISHNTAGWIFERPATTVVGSFRPDVIAAPGYRGAGDGPRQGRPGQQIDARHWGAYVSGHHAHLRPAHERTGTSRPR